jgi:membrane-bound lytic murein transglycosylase B
MIGFSQKYFLSAVLLVLFFSVAPHASAQAGDATTVADKEVKLQNELTQINQEIAGLGNTITTLKGEGVGLDRDIKILNANINKASLNIKAKNLQIARLGDGIADKARTVRGIAQRIEREKQSLAQLIRKTNEIDQASLPEMLFSGDNLSDFFLDLDSFDAVRAGLKNSAIALKSAKEQNEAAQEALENRQQQEADAKAELERNKKLVQSNESQKKQLLSITKNKEKEYSKVLAERKKRAAEIRAALFALRDSGEISFGKAYDYAQVVSAKTGIRPAFLLAVFMQESSFGKNQGSCILKNRDTGAGIGAKSGTVMQKVMNPTRDVPPFMKITAALGKDPFDTRVSCPQEVGWGGAMGAAQFIPSTWVLFEKRIMAALGTDVADPWSARDAFMAAGMYLTDLGAKSGSYSAERDAACRYFSGRKCSQSSWAATYGSQVMSKSETIQTTMIDPLNS